MWECPDFFNLDGQDVLLMSPQGLKPEGYKYHNLHQSGYVIGQLNYETGKFQHGPFHLLDYGFDVYAPQTTVDDEGRRIVIAWMNMWESVMPEQNHKWAGALTIPRVLTLEHGKIRSRPVPELQLLRQEEVSYQQIRLNGRLELAGIEGSCIEVKLTIDAMEAHQFGLKLRVNEELREETVITYDINSKLLSFDREKSGAGPKGVRHAPVELLNNKLYLHLFLDESSVEVFINDGEKVMTGRIYPDKRSSNIQIFSQGEINIIELKKMEFR